MEPQSNTDSNLPITNEDIANYSKLKWNDKVDKIEILLRFIKSKDKFDYDNNILTTYIELCLKDANINVNSSMLSFLIELTPKLKSDENYKLSIQSMFPYIVEKYKEKKDKLNDDINALLMISIKYVTNIGEFINSIKSYPSDKSIVYKSAITEFIFVNLRKSLLSVIDKELTLIIDVLSELIKDSNLDVKNCALSSLALVMKRVGKKRFEENEMSNKIEKEVIEEIEMIGMNVNYDKKYDDIEIEGKEEEVEVEEIEEEIEEEVENNDHSEIQHIEDNNDDNINKENEEKKKEKDESVVKEPPKEEKKIESNPQKKIEVKKKVDSLPAENLIKSSPPVNSNPVEEEATKTSSLNDFEKKLQEAMLQEEQMQKSKINDTTPTQPKKKKSEEDTEYTDRLSSLLTDKSIIDFFDSPKWDEKKKGLSSLNEFIEKNKSFFQSNSQNQDTIFNFIRIKLNNFKETNFNLVKEAMLCFNTLFSIPLDKKYIETLIKGTYEKMSDSKLKETLSTLINTLIENYSPYTIINNILSLMLNDKKAKLIVMKEYCIFFEKVIDDYGTDTIDLKQLISFAVNLANNTNPQARTASSSLICMIYKYVGNEIKPLLKDIKESTLKVIEGEMEKVTVLDRKTIKPKKAIKCVDESVKVNKELIQRVDISKQITPKLLKEINDGKWNEKKEAIEAIQKIITNANNKILPNGLKDLVTMIKNKLSDGNKNLVRLIIQLLGQLAEALGQGMKMYTKTLGIPLLSTLADKNSLLREDAMVCIDKWIASYNYESIALFIPHMLKNENFESRSELIKILLKNKDKYNKSYESLFKELINPFLICLQDKSSVIRNNIEELIVISLSFISSKHYYTNITEFKPAIANTLSGVLDRLISDNNIQTIEEEKQSATSSQNSTILNAKKIIPKKVTSRGEAKVSKTPSRVQQNKLPNSNNKNIRSNNNIKKLRIDRTDKVGKSPISKIKSPSKNNDTNDLVSCSVILNPKHPLLNNQNEKSKVNIFLTHYKPKSSAKEKRSEIDKKNKFNIESKDFEYINKVKDNMKFIFTAEQINKLYHNDVKKNVLALGLITSSLNDEDDKPKVIENFDIILKYIAWKISTNQNPSLVKSFFELCEAAAKVISNETLNDTEINILFNLLSDKLTSPNTAFKDTARSLLNDYVALVGKQKSFSVLLSLLVVKMNKIRCEMIDVINTIYSTGEIDNNTLTRNVKMIIKAYAVGDTAVRNKIIDLIKEVYLIMHNDFWKYTTELVDKDKRMLMDKLKELDSNEEEEEIETSSHESHNEEEDDTENMNTITIEKKEHSSSTLTIEVLSQILSNLNNPSINIIESILAVNEAIYKSFDKNKDLLISNSDLIINTFITSLSNLFYTKPLQVKITKYITNVLCKISTIQSLISSISFPTLKSLINLVLTSVLYEKLNELGDNNEGVVIWKSFNSIMLRILEFCDGTSTISILLDKEKQNRLKNPKLAEYSARCIFKLSQSLEEKINTIEVSTILGGIHDLLVDYENSQPDLQIKNQTDQIVILSVKNLVVGMTKIKKEVIIEDYIKGVESKDINDKYIKRWMKSELEVKKEDSTTVTSTNNFDTLKSNIEEMVKNKTSSGQHSIQNDKLNQLKQKLTTLNKVSSIGMMNKNQDEAMKTKQHKSFNQIQKKWKDVFSRTQRNNTSTKDK